MCKRDDARANLAAIVTLLHLVPRYGDDTLAPP
jgi:hypothetical protein